MRMHNPDYLESLISVPRSTTRGVSTPDAHRYWNIFIQCTRYAPLEFLCLLRLETFHDSVGLKLKRHLLDLD